MAERATNQEGPQGAAASLLNGLGVLEAFSIEKPILGVTEIAQKVNLHKSTVSRILTGLAAAGYVERDEATGRFRLGLGLIGLSGPLLAELDVRRVAQPALERLTEQTQETSALSVWNGHEAVVVEQIPSPHYVKHTAAIGTRYDRYESSSVRVFLAEQPDDVALAMLKSGEITHSSDSGLGRNYLEHLAAVRAAGYAVNDGNTSFEELGISALVRDYRGVAVGCVTTSAPRSRVDKDRLEVLAQAVMETARGISARLGLPSARQAGGGVSV